MENIIGLDSKLLQKLNIHYPKIMDRVIPLSKTGVNARTFFDWKKMELIQFTDSAEREWIKLNLIEYSWVKVIQLFREFGVSYENILKMKQQIYNSSHLIEILRTSDDLIKYIKSKKTSSEEDIENFKKFISFFNENYNIEEYDFTLTTFFAQSIIKTIVMNDDAVVLGYLSTDGGMIFSCLNYRDLRSGIEKNPLYTNHIQILLRPIIEELFEKNEFEKHVLRLGLLNENEQKILSAVRDKNVSEVKIQYNGKDEPIVEILKVKNIKNDEAIRLRKILGLNKYDEITIKYRNDKELFIKNKKRIK